MAAELLLSEDQVEAISRLVGHRRLAKMRYFNDRCIVGRAPEQLGIKVTHRWITLAKYNQPPVITVPVDTVLRARLFGMNCHHTCSNALLPARGGYIGIDIDV
jgi:hypothetical protein